MIRLLAAALLIGLALATSAPAAPPGALEAKVRSIVLPKVEFEEAEVGMVVEFLRRTAKELDPDKEGVNIFLKLDPATPANKRPVVTLNLTNIPLGEVIRYVCLAAGLNYKIDDTAVIMADRSLPLAGTMETRVYNVAPGVLDAAPTRKKVSRMKLDGEQDNGNRN